MVLKWSDWHFNYVQTAVEWLVITKLPVWEVRDPPVRQYTAVNSDVENNIFVVFQYYGQQILVLFFTGQWNVVFTLVFKKHFDSIFCLAIKSKLKSKRM